MSDDVIGLLVRNQRNRQLLESELAETYTASVLSDPAAIPATAFDLLLVDEANLERARPLLETKADAAFPIPLPVVLLRSSDTTPPPPDVWQSVDDVVHLPTNKARLTARTENLLRTRRLAQNYHETQERLNSVVETASDGIVILDADLTVVFANPATATLLGLDEERLVGASIDALFSDPDAGAVHERLSAIVTDESPVDCPAGTIDTTVRQHSGKDSPIQLAYRAFEHDGEVFLTGILHDVSDLKQRELRLQVLNRILRHDIRNDINIIEGYVELADADGDIDPEYMAAIRENIREIADLSEKARQLDYLFETTDTPLTELDVVPILKRVLSRLETSHPDVAFEADLPKRALVSGVELLSSAFDNLVENAVEHNDHADLTVSVSVTSDEEVVTVEIADTGDGIPDDEIAVLEQRQETAIDHTSGLGLWLVNWLVRASNGDIRFEPNEPHGSRIILTFPTASEG